jgi:hypothetical protein
MILKKILLLFIMQGSASDFNDPAKIDVFVIQPD